MATDTTRIYTVTNVQTGKKHLVEASNQSQAIRLVVGSHYSAEVTSALDLAALMEAGNSVLRAAATPATHQE